MHEETEKEKGGKSKRDSVQKRRRKPRRLAYILKKIYTDLRNPASYSSPYKLYKAARKIHDGIRLEQVKEWLESQDTYTLFRRVPLRFKRVPVITRGLGYQQQADLVDYAPLKRDNSGVTFLLTIIDCFTRFALAVPIKRKTGPLVAEALSTAWKTMKPPVYFQTDKGTEFYNKDVAKLLRKHGVHHFSTHQELKAQIAERFNRTLRRALKMHMAEKKTLRYIDYLPDFLYGYNHRPHSAIYPYAPVEVNVGNEKKIHDMQYGDYLRAKKPKPKYSIGDKVRITAYRGTFTKSYSQKNFTEEVFEIVDCYRTKPPMYRLKDLDKGELIQGTFYESELQRVRTDNGHI